MEKKHQKQNKKAINKLSKNTVPYVIDKCYNIHNTGVSKNRDILLTQRNTGLDMSRQFKKSNTRKIVQPYLQEKCKFKITPRYNFSLSRFAKVLQKYWQGYGEPTSQTLLIGMQNGPAHIYERPI